MNAIDTDRKSASADGNFWRSATVRELRSQGSWLKLISGDAQLAARAARAIYHAAIIIVVLLSLIVGSIFLLLFTAVSAHAQGDTVTTRTVVVLPQNPPTPVQRADVRLVGNPGGAVYYYWVVATCAAGNASPAGPFAIFNAPNTLSGSSYVTVAWRASPCATSYDVLRTTTVNQPTGACACAVATAVSGTSTNDQSNSLNAYTVTTFDPGTVAVNLTNNNGTLNANGQAIGSGSLPTGCSADAPNGLACDHFASNGSASPDIFGPIPDPGSPATGSFWLSSTNAGRFKWWDGSATQTVIGAATADTLTNKSIAETELTFTDVVTSNVSTTKHGFTPKLPNDATKYLDGTGAYSVPAGAGGGGTFIDWQKAAGSSTTCGGLGTPTTVYTTAIASVPAGKCVHAKVWWVRASGTDTLFGHWTFGAQDLAIGGDADTSTSSLRYTQAAVCNDPAVQNAQTMLSDLIISGASVQGAGGSTTAAQDTTTSKNLVFKLECLATSSFTGKGWEVWKDQ